MSDTPRTKAGQWLLDRARWDEGMRGFFVRINATGAPDDMHRHILAIEAEARRDAVAEWRGLLEKMADPVSGLDLVDLLTRSVSDDPDQPNVGALLRHWAEQIRALLGGSDG